MYGPNVLYDFTPRRYNDLELKQEAHVIIKKMTGNPHFPDPVPSLSELKQALERYSQSLTDATDGTKEDTLVKKKNRHQLRCVLFELAMYVQRVCHGDAAIILSSGFDVRKTPAKIGPLPQPTGFSVQYNGQSGSVTLRCDVIKKATNYKFEYVMEQEGKDNNWEYFVSTKHTIKITGLEKDRYYAFRVTGIGTDPSRHYTDVIRKMVV